jgi:putative ABC transport system substrate-binding protein
MKKFLFIFSVWIVILFFNNTPFYARTETQVWKIGIVYPGPHPLVDDVLNGLRSGFKEKELKEGKDILLVMKDGQGDPANFSSISQAVIAEGANIIVPIATPTAQAAVKENAGRRPIVFIAVTDPIGAGILTDMERPGNNITGVSDAWPYAEQLGLLKTIMPNAKRIGVMYNPSEANSIYGIRQIRKIVPSFKLEIVEGTISGPSELSSRAINLITTDHVDAIYLSSDNTILGAAESVIKVGEDYKIPIFSGDDGTVKRGTLAAVSIGYFEVGKLAAGLIFRVIKGENAGSIPIEIARGNDIHINLDAASKMGIRVPEDVLKKAKKIYGTGSEAKRQIPIKYIYIFIFLAIIIIATLIIIRKNIRKDQI